MFQKGFWNELDTLREDFKGLDIAWDGVFDNFEDEALPNLKFMPYNYLHGLCDTFAQALNNIFGYQIEYIIQSQDPSDKDSPINLIHAYCLIETETSVLYADVRGITDDYDKFLAEFDITKDDIDEDYTYTVASYEPIDQYSYSNSSSLIIETERIIQTYKDYYKINNFAMVG